MPIRAAYNFHITTNNLYGVSQHPVQVQQSVLKVVVGPSHCFGLPPSTDFPAPAAPKTHHSLQAVASFQESQIVEINAVITTLKRMLAVMGTRKAVLSRLNRIVQEVANLEEEQINVARQALQLCVAQVKLKGYSGGDGHENK